MARKLDFDHLGAKIGQDHGAIGTRQDSTQIQDSNSLERFLFKHFDVALLRKLTAPRAGLGLRTHRLSRRHYQARLLLGLSLLF